MTTNETTMIKCTRPNCKMQIEPEAIKDWQHSYAYDKAKRPFCSYKCGQITVQIDERKAKRILTDANKKFLKTAGFKKYEYGWANRYSYRGNWFYATETEYSRAAHFLVSYQEVSVELQPRRIDRVFEIAEHTPEAIQNAFDEAIEFIKNEPTGETIFEEAKAQRAPKAAELLALDDLEAIVNKSLSGAQCLLSNHLNSNVTPFAIINVLESNVRSWKSLLREIDCRRNNTLLDGQPKDSPVLEAVDRSQHTPSYLNAVKQESVARERLASKNDA